MGGENDLARQAGTAPVAVDMKADEVRFWCSCGRSASQPFCDGSHKGTSFSPVEYRAGRDGKVWFCTCKATGRQPVCDGAHKKLPRQDPAPA